MYAFLLTPSGHVGSAMFALEHQAGQLETTPGNVQKFVLF